MAGLKFGWHDPGEWPVNRWIDLGSKERLADAIPFSEADGESQGHHAGRQVGKKGNLFQFAQERLIILATALCHQLPVHRVVEKESA